jgi:hypothetical protein
MANNIKVNMLAFICNFYKITEYKFELMGCYPNKSIFKTGVPQASVLSVTLFLAAINDIITGIMPSVKSCLFADNVTTYCKGEVPHTTEDLLQEELKRIQNWARLEASYCPKLKQNVCHFRGPSAKCTTVVCFLYNSRIETVDNIPTWDSRLTTK